MAAGLAEKEDVSGSFASCPPGILGTFTPACPNTFWA
jgi:hypothetical protein